MTPVSAPAHDELDVTVLAELAAIESPRRNDPHLLQTFDAMAGSRLLDIEARRLRERGRGFYTIGSSGHESNAFVAEATRTSDPALLHYRSGAFYLARSLQAGRSLDDGLRDILLSLSAATADPASGGRHKVFGHPELAIIPQTSTIASHLPRAVGVAFAIDRARRLGLPTRWPLDAIAVCSFGDASLNHSTAVGALNTAGYCAHSGLGMPVLFVCEDNGLGISVPVLRAGWSKPPNGRGCSTCTRTAMIPKSFRPRPVRGRPGPCQPSSRHPASADGAAAGPRRHRRREQLSQCQCDRRRSGS